MPRLYGQKRHQDTDPEEGVKPRPEVGTCCAQALAQQRVVGRDAPSDFLTPSPVVFSLIKLQYFPLALDEDRQTAPAPPPIHTRYMQCINLD